MLDSPFEGLETFFKNDDPQQLVIFTHRYWIEDGQWLGECVELGTATYGVDCDEVRSELSELVVHALNSLEEDGERKNFFSKHGIETLKVPQHLGGLLDLLPKPLEPAIPYWAVPPARHEFAAAGG